MASPRAAGGIVRVTTTTAPRFEALLRRAGTRAGLLPLLRAFGFEPRPLPLAPADFGLDEASGAASVARLAERGGLDVLLVELDGDAGAERVAAIARRIRAHNPARPRLLLFAGPRYRHLVLASFGLEGELRQLTVERRRPRATEVEALEEMVAAEGEGGTALALRHARALDRTRVTRSFFRDFRAQRNAIAAAWTGIPAPLAEERGRLALLLLSRLMFLYFLQRRGHLAGEPDYLRGRLRRWQREPARGSFFHSVLRPLFFGALNTRPASRTAEARALGPLPYLNGGLFERTALERRFPELDLPDDVAAAVFDALLDRYRFTTREAADAAIDGAGDPGIDPEMLGRVFEGLMAADRRGATGTFYTPAPVVDRLVCETLAVYLEGRPGLEPGDAAALARGSEIPLDPRSRERLLRDVDNLRILDPACGSGAFLLGALARVGRLRTVLSGGGALEARRALVARALHGVDVQEDAALLCALRLWLALVAGDAEPVPLPNLDRRIRQGDALLDPLDLTGAEEGVPAWRAAAADLEVRRRVREISTATSAYVGAEPDERPALQRRLAEAEVGLARAWLDVLERRVRARLRGARAWAEARDLFGARPVEAARAEAELPAIEARAAEIERLRTGLDDAGALPFFSFDVHFAEAGRGGFDLILSNPPWVRAHRWPSAVARLVRRRSAVCREASWRPASLMEVPGGNGGQVDLSLLFLERSVRLLAPRGALGMLLPAKLLRSLYAAGARRLLLTDTTLAEVEDHSLDQRSIFRADAFTTLVVARARPAPGGAGGEGPAPDRPVRVTMVRRGGPPLRFALPAHDLPLAPGDPAAPWLLAPPSARAAIRRMQAAAPPLGAHAGIRIRRGIETGANDVLVLSRARARLGGLAQIRSSGHGARVRAGAPAAERRRFEAVVEAESVRPLVRGADIAAWSWRTSRYVLWPRPCGGGVVPPHTARYLDQHASALAHRHAPRGLGGDEGRPKVAWRDIGRTLEAVALPARAAAPDGARALMPLNTVYFVALDREEDALALAALLNSLPVRVFARAVAERAKDAHFRFFAWTLALLPLPPRWRDAAEREDLVAISRRAHADRGIGAEDAARLDRAAARLYGLAPDDLDALAGFDRWLSGEEAAG